MKIEIKTKHEAQELLRGIRLTEKYCLPFVASLDRIKKDLEEVVKE